MLGEWLIKEPQGHRLVVDYNVTPKYVCSNCNREAIKTSEEHLGHGEYVVEHRWIKLIFVHIVVLI